MTYAIMRKLKCFVIIPSGKNPPMRLAPDEKLGLCVVPSSCEVQKDEIKVNFQIVYKNIVEKAIEAANDEIKRAMPSAAVEIECKRGEDSPEGGNIVSQFLRDVCEAEITITDLTGLNPNVLLEYGVRLSVKDSLNIVLCHDGLKLPQDVADQRYIPYALELMAADKARGDIVRAICHGLPALLGEHPRATEEPNLFRRTVELASGRTLERSLARALEPAPVLIGKLVNEIQRLDRLGREGGGQARAEGKLSFEAWTFMDALGKTLREDRSGVERALELYRHMAGLKAFSDRRRDIYYTLHEISAGYPDRSTEAEAYLRQATELDV